MTISGEGPKPKLDDAELLSLAEKRGRQTDCQIEPAYCGHETVLMSMLDPELCAHRPTARCLIEEIHSICECKEFED